MLPLDNYTGTLWELILPAQSDSEVSSGEWKGFRRGEIWKSTDLRQYFNLLGLFSFG